MPPSPPIVYVDTNVVIEAHRTGCWQALAARYDIHTERECWRELGRGDPRDPDYVMYHVINRGNYRRFDPVAGREVEGG